MTVGMMMKMMKRFPLTGLLRLCRIRLLQRDVAYR